MAVDRNAGAGDDVPPAAYNNAAAAPAADAVYSITAHFDGACNVLLTGASGYIGSLVLEKLLRSTTVGRVYVLLRSRRGVAPAERLAKLLTGPLFHLLDETQTARVTAVAGDILEPGLGLSEEDEATLVANVDTVIHSAADIRLDAPIHDTLQANYLGSCAMTRLASRMARIRSYVYVSTCYVNINKAPHSNVDERVYPINLGGREVETHGIAEELLSLPEADAEALAAKYIDLWGFKNTYAMGKHLAEKAVVRLVGELRLPLAIVRPSLVSSVAAEPYAGYAGNFAGLVGGAAAYLVGLYNDQPEAAATNGDSIWDVIPGDIVAHAVIATAAAAASAATRAHVMAPLRSGAEGEGDYMIVQVGSSTTYPLTFAQIFNTGVLWCTAHKRPFTMAFSRARGMPPDQKYDEQAWRKHMKSATSKCNTLTWVLRRMGGKRRLRMARTIEAGLSTFETVNDPKYDLQLLFSSGVLQRLESCLSPSDSSDFRIVWRAPAPADAAAAADKASAAAGAARLLVVADAASSAATSPAGSSGGSTAGPSDSSAASSSAASSVSAEDDLATRRARIAAITEESMEGGWPLFLFNMLTYLWKTIYGREVSRDTVVKTARLRKLMPHLSKEELAAIAHVRHTFEALA
ncbi:hypothetical protein Rsub_03863 [Raphidocelis subcapitata]|uniref:Fatty acyl-CoA reductase n=1 Tax=Raphidocelis subcapitata TaxID=307507 RepID=A0A2V0NTK6_9CHLO|nr:hypothetical protein Rsub_03863 [Raphidocelis subcapitata]|eukprot:GBF91008.1 hypothetical protein Rsub_03863 [Raphidocelis subcapitata]